MSIDSSSILLYHFESSNSLQTVPCTFASGSFDQLKLFNGFAGCGTFFFVASGFGGIGAVGNGKICKKSHPRHSIANHLSVNLLLICMGKGGQPGAGGGKGGIANGGAGGIGATIIGGGGGGGDCPLQPCKPATF